MGRASTISEPMVEAARKLVRRAESARELRTGLSVTLPKALGVSNAQTAEVLGVGLATVVRMQKAIRDQVAGKACAKGSWGGRRRQLLSEEDEARFLAPWVAQAESGGVLVVPPIHAALEQHLGRQLPASTVYRMLARHGWRKVAPDTGHPQRDAQAQAEFKKNSPKRWHKPRR